MSDQSKWVPLQLSISIWKPKSLWMCQTQRQWRPWMSSRPRKGKLNFYFLFKPRPCMNLRRQILILSVNTFFCCFIMNMNDCLYEKDYLVCNLPNKSKLHIVQLHVVQKCIDIANNFLLFYYSGASNQTFVMMIEKKPI